MKIELKEIDKDTLKVGDVVGGINVLGTQDIVSGED